MVLTRRGGMPPILDASKMSQMRENVRWEDEEEGVRLTAIRAEADAADQ
jgi:hypothetical protein